MKYFSTTKIYISRASNSESIPCLLRDVHDAGVNVLAAGDLTAMDQKLLPAQFLVSPFDHLA
jgi:hypothetical protein